jgi:CheY-like chemotaxis protein
MEQNKWILVAEDDENDRFFIARALGQATLPIQVVFAHDGWEVLACLERSGRFSNLPPGVPAVIILDHAMPALNGLEVLRRIRSSPSYGLVPVVMHSSQMNPREVQQAYRLGANAYVEKPMGLDQLSRIFKELGIFWATINVAPITADAIE